MSTLFSLFRFEKSTACAIYIIYTTIVFFINAVSKFFLQKEQKMKEFGVLCHVTCLPAKTGLGDFGKSAYEFLDFLKSQKLSLWQILPLNNANEFNCPYGPLSTQAIDEMFVDLDDLKDRGLLEEKEYKHLYKFTKTKKVKFSKIRPEKERLFALAYSRIAEEDKKQLEKIAKQHKHIYEYAYYRTMLAKFGQKSWRFVEDQYWDIYGKVGKMFVKENKDQFLKFVFFQYILHEQWTKIKTYANSLGIKILGDVPMYCDKDSVDVFAGKQLITSAYYPGRGRQVPLRSSPCRRG